MPIRFSIATLLWLMYAVAIVAAATKWWVPLHWTVPSIALFFAAWIAATSRKFQGWAWGLFALGGIWACYSAIDSILWSFVVISGFPTGHQTQTDLLYFYFCHSVPILLFAVPMYVAMRCATTARPTRGDWLSLWALAIGWVGVTFAMTVIIFILDHV